MRWILEAEGGSQAIELRAKAQAAAIRTLAETLKESDDMREAAKLYVAKQYIDMYGQMGAQSNTMLFSDKPADINALMVINATGKSDSNASSKEKDGDLADASLMAKLMDK